MNVKKDTLIRTIVLGIALINQCLAILGKTALDITDDQVYQVVSLMFTIATTIRAWWKNNSFTHEAKLADEYKDELKAQRKLHGGESEAVDPDNKEA